MREPIGVDVYNLCITGRMIRTLSARDFKTPPCVIEGGCYTIDDTKMNTVYVDYELANTLTRRDYKNPQTVIYETRSEECPTKE